MPLRKKYLLTRDKFQKIFFPPEIIFFNELMQIMLTEFKQQRNFIMVYTLVNNMCIIERENKS